MNDLLNKPLLIVFFLSLSLPGFSQSTALSFYSYRDISVVFPEFCIWNFIGGENYAIDTINRFGIDVDSPIPYLPNRKVGDDYDFITSSLPGYTCKENSGESPFTNFTVSINTHARKTIVTTLNIGNIELWHRNPVIQKVYPLTLEYYLNLKLSEEDILIITSIKYINDCKHEEFSLPTRVNIYKLVSDVDLNYLLEWSKYLMDMVEFYPVSYCTGYYVDPYYLNYYPCESTH